MGNAGHSQWMVALCDNATVGGATFDVMLLIGALTALVHSRKSKA